MLSCILRVGCHSTRMLPCCVSAAVLRECCCTALNAAMLRECSATNERLALPRRDEHETTTHLGATLRECCHTREVSLATTR
ncbi:hypothetical protein BDZ91DRAFT_36133 [Kalaharituber pfeilii]|nr:hypothetical protein BDZ91DRAFT_36133 [Kalaharituber pfeilii]